MALQLFSVLVFIGFIIATVTAVSTAPSSNEFGTNTNGWNHKKHHRHGRHHDDMFNMPLNMCGVDCSASQTPEVPSANNNTGPQQQCWTCTRNCKQNSVAGEPNRNQTRACMDNVFISIVPDGSCSDAFNCYRECIKTIKHNPHRSGERPSFAFNTTQRHGKNDGDIQNCLTTSCPNFCSSVQSCGGGSQGEASENQVCVLQQKLRRAGRQCDPCHEQCVQEGSCIADYI